MSNELTLEILHINGYSTDAASVVAFITTADLNRNEEEILLRALETVELPKNPLKNSTDLKKFIETELIIPIPPEKVMMYLKNLPDDLDKDKSLKKKERLLTLVPVEYLNKFSLPNLISNTMDKDFWKDRVTNNENRSFFKERFERYASTQEKQIYELEHLLKKETDWSESTFATLREEAGSEIEYLRLLDKDAKSLGLK